MRVLKLGAHLPAPHKCMRVHVCACMIGLVPINIVCMYVYMYMFTGVCVCVCDMFIGVCMCVLCREISYREVVLPPDVRTGLCVRR